MLDDEVYSARRTMRVDDLVEADAPPAPPPERAVQAAPPVEQMREAGDAAEVREAAPLPAWTWTADVEDLRDRARELQAPNAPRGWLANAGRETLARSIDAREAAIAEASKALEWMGAGPPNLRIGSPLAGRCGACEYFGGAAASSATGSCGRYDTTVAEVELCDSFTSLPRRDTQADDALAEAHRLAPAAPAMVALYPPPELAERLAVRGGEPPEDLHVTIAYLGKHAWADGNLEKLRDVVRGVAATHGSLRGVISGRGVFTEGPKPVTYLSVDLPALPGLRQRLAQALRGAGVPADRAHGFSPHLTLAYRNMPSYDAPRGIDLDFGELVVVVGDKREAFPLRGTAALREATKANRRLLGPPEFDEGPPDDDLELVDTDIDDNGKATRAHVYCGGDTFALGTRVTGVTKGKRRITGRLDADRDGTVTVAGRQVKRVVAPTKGERPVKEARLMEWDPDQPRDPRNGEWIRKPGGQMRREQAAIFGKFGTKEWGLKKGTRVLTPSDDDPLGEGTQLNGIVQGAFRDENEADQVIVRRRGETRVYPHDEIVMRHGPDGRSLKRPKLVPTARQPSDKKEGPHPDSKGKLKQNGWGLQMGQRVMVDGRWPGVVRGVLSTRPETHVMVQFHPDDPPDAVRYSPKDTLSQMDQIKRAAEAQGSRVEMTPAGERMVQRMVDAGPSVVPILEARADRDLTDRAIDAAFNRVDLLEARSRPGYEPQGEGP